jgi:hypothetical protein
MTREQRRTNGPSEEGGVQVLDDLELVAVSLVPPEEAEGFQGGTVEVPEGDP